MPQPSHSRGNGNLDLAPGQWSPVFAGMTSGTRKNGDRVVVPATGRGQQRSFWREFFMPRCGSTTDEKSNDSPLGGGKGRQALGWVVD